MKKVISPLIIGFESKNKYAIIGAVFVFVFNCSVLTALMTLEYLEKAEEKIIELTERVYGND